MIEQAIGTTTDAEGCVPSSSAYQCPSRSHHVKGAYGVARDRFATLTCRPLTRDSAPMMKMVEV
jgi:hypothetical protein